MVIGSWGDLVFEVTGNIARTFQELSQKSSGRWAEHETINTAPLSEFLGPGLDELEIAIIFTTMLGVDPRESYEGLRAAVRKGECHPLILGGVPLSDNLWRLTEISGNSTVFGPRDGEILWMELSVTAKEYN
ncbi:MAG: phage tail protein [Treponema sp.]|jgi:phage protein U|nr:phage tail protein [Treponema sp.]